MSAHEDAYKLSLQDLLVIVQEAVYVICILSITYLLDDIGLSVVKWVPSFRVW